MRWICFDLDPTYHNYSTTYVWSGFSHTSGKGLLVYVSCVDRDCGVSFDLLWFTEVS